jgi:TonB family protein
MARFVGNVQTYSKTLARVALDSVTLTPAYGGIAMIRKSEIRRRLDFLKQGIGIISLAKPRIGLFLLIAAISLVGITGLRLVAEKELIPEVLAQENKADEKEYLKVAEVMPKVKFMPPRPEMPEQIAAAGVDSAMVVQFFIDEKGIVNSKLTRIHKSSGYPELDKLALDWAGKMEFYPALNKGRPVKVQVAIPIKWKTK